MIQCDIHEPLEVIRLIEPVHDVDQVPLNDEGWGDYKWTGEMLVDCPEGDYHHERKLWSDFASDLDSIEDLLRRQHKSHPKAKHRLIIEGGGIEPAPRGVIVYTRRQGQNIMVGRQLGNQSGLYKKIMGWIAECSRYMEIYFSASHAGTAALLCELYEHDQKTEEERKTFQRYSKPMNWNPNPQVQMMLGLATGNTGLGPILAERLIQRYGTVWNVIHASPQDWGNTVKGISGDAARTFLRKIGRTDV